MPEQAPYPEPHTGDGEKSKFLQNVVEMERTLMKMQRTEKVLREIEQRYLALMDSSVFLCFILDADGKFRAMNRRAEEFFGFQVKPAASATLQSFSTTAHAAEVEYTLKNAIKEPVHTALSFICADGVARWLDMECSRVTYHGNESIQIIAFDITDLMERKADKADEVDKVDKNVSSEKPAADSRSAESFSQADFLSVTPGMFLIADDNARCVEVSANFLSALKLIRGDVVGRSIDEFLLPSVNEGTALNGNATRDLTIAVREGAFENLECKIVSKDGETLSLGLAGTRMQLEGNACTLISCIDNTKLRRAEEQLKRASTTDVSTGILNRQGMELVLKAEIESAVKYRGPLTLIMLDIDGFRKLNERLGYVASDKVLKEFAAMVKLHICLADFFGRWGGDEFVILMHLPLEEAMRMVEKLRGMVREAFKENDQLMFSAGVAAFHKSMDVSSFVGAAYDAMIAAKKDGGNRTVRAQEREI